MDPNRDAVSGIERRTKSRQHELEFVGSHKRAFDAVRVPRYHFDHSHRLSRVQAVGQLKTTQNSQLAVISLFSRE